MITFSILTIWQLDPWNKFFTLAWHLGSERPWSKLQSTNTVSMLKPCERSTRSHCKVVLVDLSWAMLGSKLIIHCLLRLRFPLSLPSDFSPRSAKGVVLRHYLGRYVHPRGNVYRGKRSCHQMWLHCWPRRTLDSTTEMARISKAGLKDLNSPLYMGSLNDRLCWWALGTDWDLQNVPVGPRVTKVLFHLPTLTVSSYSSNLIWSGSSTMWTGFALWMNKLQYTTNSIYTSATGKLCSEVPI